MNIKKLGFIKLTAMYFRRFNKHDIPGLSAEMSFYLLTALFPFVILQVYVFCVGLGLFLAQANVFFRDIQYIYNAITTAWLYTSCIFYPIKSLPDWLQWVITHLNPMYFYIAQFRAIIHQGTLPDMWFVLAGIVAAFLSLVAGTLFFFKSKDRFILYI